MCSVRLIAGCLVASIAVIGCVATILSPAFETNDDVVMLLTASGRLFTSAPDEHLLFINVAVGATLRWLYERAPSVPWYSLFLYVSLAFASALSLAACLRWRPRALVSGLTWALVLSTLAAFALALTFTAVAVWLAGASLLWVVSVARGSADRFMLMRNASLGIGGILLAGLIRPEGAGMGLLVAAPLLLWVLATAGVRRAIVAGGIAAIGAFAVLGSIAANTAYYESSADWEEFYDLNWAKTIFIDTGLVRPSEATTEAIRSVGWSDTDLRMAQEWFFLHDEIFSLEKMNAVIDGAVSRDLSRVATGLDRLGRRDGLRQVAIGLAVVLVMVAPSRVWLWLAGMGGWYVAVALVTAFAFRALPGRVDVACLAIVVCSGLLLASASKLGRSSWSAVVVSGLLFLPPALAGVKTAVNDSSRHASDVREFRDDWRGLASSRPRLIVGWAGTFPFQLMVSPFDEGFENVTRAPVVSMSTLTRTPFTRTRLEEAGIADLHVALVEDPRVTLIAAESQVSLLLDFLSEHYGDAVAEPWLVGKTFKAWRLVRSDASRLAEPGD